jgi:hypothetical protein
MIGERDKFWEDNPPPLNYSQSELRAAEMVQDQEGLGLVHAAELVHAAAQARGVTGPSDFLASLALAVLRVPLVREHEPVPVDDDTERTVDVDEPLAEAQRTISMAPRERRRAARNGVDAPPRPRKKTGQT